MTGFNSPSEAHKLPSKSAAGLLPCSRRFDIRIKCVLWLDDNKTVASCQDTSLLSRPTHKTMLNRMSFY